MDPTIIDFCRRGPQRPLTDLLYPYFPLSLSSADLSRTIEIPLVLQNIHNHQPYLPAINTTAKHKTQSLLPQPIPHSFPSPSPSLPLFPIIPFLIFSCYPRFCHIKLHLMKAYNRCTQGICAAIFSPSRHVKKRYNVGHPYSPGPPRKTSNIQTPKFPKFPTPKTQNRKPFPSHNPSKCKHRVSSNCNCAGRARFEHNI